MLHVLTERNAGNSLAIVVRYFGGVKLGAGGLVRAYSGAVSHAVNQAQLTQVTPKIQLFASVDFARETKVRYLVSHYQGQVLAVDYAVQVTLHIELETSQAELFRRQLINETAGAAQVSIAE